MPLPPLSRTSAEVGDVLGDDQDTFLLVDGLAAASSTWSQSPPRM
jgi:hypothetical protein